MQFLKLKPLLVQLSWFCLLTPFHIYPTYGKKTEIRKGASEEQCLSVNSPSGNKTEGCRNTRNRTKLALVQVIFRHGDRTPLFTWPTNPHSYKKSNSTVAQMFQRQGLLTKRGKVQGYELGTFLATRYKEYLERIWIPDDVHVQSSDVERAVMTAQTLLAGLFLPSQCSEKEPGGCEGRWSKDIRWQPIPVYTIAKKDDNKINFHGNRERCPAYVHELENVLGCEKMQDFVEENQPLFEDIKKHTGLAEVNINNIGLIYDTLFVQSTYGLKLPNWTNPYYPKKLKEMEELVFQVISANREMMKFNGGPLLKEVIDNMKKVAVARSTGKQRKGGGDSCDSSRRHKKLYMYSGHDTTVAAFLSTLGLLHPHQPAYTSAVIVELHESVKNKAPGNTETSEYTVKVFYRNASKSSLQELKISQCDNPCYLDKLEQVSHDLFPENWKRACEGTDGILGWLWAPLQKLLTVLSKKILNAIRSLWIAGCDECT